MAGTLSGLFSQILNGDELVRERCIKFMSTKMKTAPEAVWTKEVEDYLVIESKKVIFHNIYYYLMTVHVLFCTLYQLLSMDRK